MSRAEVEFILDCMPPEEAMGLLPGARLVREIVRAAETERVSGPGMKDGVL